MFKFFILLVVIIFTLIGQHKKENPFSHNRNLVERMSLISQCRLIRHQMTTINDLRINKYDAIESAITNYLTNQHTKEADNLLIYFQTHGFDQ